MRRTRPLAAVLALVLSGGLLAACGSSGSRSSNGDGEPVRGGDLIYLDAEIPYSFTFNNLGYWQNQAIANQILDRLVFLDPDAGSIHPWIAESWNVSEDGRTYEFHIRDGVTYSDGSTLDAENVRRNLEFQAYGDDKGNTRNTNFPKVASITADNSTRTVLVRLEQPNTYFLNQLAYHTAGLVSSAYFDLTFEEQGKGPNLLGSGPFVIESSNASETKIVKRDGYAWAPKDLPNQSEAYLDSVTFIPVDEDSVRLGTLSSGQADLLRYIDPTEEKGAKAKGLQVIAQTYPDQPAYLLAFRTDVPHANDPNIRKAIQVGIDRKRLIDTIYSDSYTPATGLFGAAGPDAVDQSALLTYRPEESKRLLEASGWTLPAGKDGIRVNAAGERLELTTLVDVYTVGSPALFQFLQLQFKELGIDLKLNQVDYASYPEAARNPAIAFLYLGGGKDAAFAISRAVSSTGSDTLKLRGSDPVLDDLATRHVTGNLPEAERKAVVAQLQNHIIENAYILPITERVQAYAAQPDVHGFSQTQSAPWLYLTWKE